MSEPLDPLAVGAEQYIDEVMRAKALPGPIDRGERLLRSDGSLPARDRLAAVVAVAAGRMVALAEIAEQHLPPAGDRFAIADQRLDLLPFDAALTFGGIARVDQPQQVHDVGDAVAHPRIGRQTVAPGAAGFLIIRFEVFWCVEMGDKADIGLVDAHAEGDRRRDDDALLAQKALLVAFARRAVETGMIGQRRAPARCEPARSFLNRLTGE